MFGIRKPRTKEEKLMTEIEKIGNKIREEDKQKRQKRLMTAIREGKVINPSTHTWLKMKFRQFFT